MMLMMPGNPKKKSGSEEGTSSANKQQKVRHIVTWTEQEDDILRHQIGTHGTENWTIIASKFKDKTTRQCRRRWYTYLNSDFKKGGWSPEEDMLLCEAQKIFGNRWTEIAKVVSGRTDNAVKNRFNTLCKKRAKCEALAKENNASYINQNNKRILVQNVNSTDGTPELVAPYKRMRQSNIPGFSENYNNTEEKLLQKYSNTMPQQLRTPFAELSQNFNNVANLSGQHHFSNIKDINDVQSDKIHGTYLKKDDPKITALMQQAELLSSLALKVNAENTDGSLENAWKVLQDFQNRSKGNDMLRFNFPALEFQLEDFKDLVDDLKRNEGTRSFWSQPDLYEETSTSSEYSSGSSLFSQTSGSKAEQPQGEFSGIHQDIDAGLQTSTQEEQNGCDDGKNVIHTGTTNQEEIFLSYDEPGNNDGVGFTVSSAEFSSPLQVTPLFRSFAAGIPSPKFSESERNFLLKTFGMESPSTKTDSSQPPHCKRALLSSLY